MSATAPAQRAAPAVPELEDAHRSSRVVPYIKEIWARRNYIWYVAVQELRSRQVTNVLGNMWHLLNPLLSIAVYYVIFGLLLQVDRGVDNFLLFLTVGLFVFQYTQKATIDGAKSIITNGGLIKAIRFPRAILPITSTITELLASLSTFAMMYVILLVGGESPRPSWLLFPVVIAVQTAFNLGSAMVAARMTTHFRDMTQILPFVFRLLLYGSGVIYSVDAYVDDSSWVIKALFVLNPMYCYLTTARWTIFGGELDPAVVVSGTVWAIALLIGGFLWFRAAEDRYARD
jgi:teichoic acid transport system permease protein